MFFAAPLVNADSWFEGAWTISGAKFPGISAVGIDDISPYIGDVKITRAVGALSKVNEQIKRCNLSVR